MSDASKSADVLIQGYLEGTLSEAECAQLLALLRSDPTKVRLVLDNLRMDTLLREVVGETSSELASSRRRQETLTGFPNPAREPDDLSLVTSTATRFRGSFHEAFRKPLHVLALALAASVALAIGLSLWLFPSANNEPTLTVPTGTQVALERAGHSLPAQGGLKLLPGDLLRISGSNGAAITYGNENTRVTLEDHTDLKILAWLKGKRLELRQGKVQATAARQRLWSPMILVTAQAEARVLGAQFSLGVTTNATRLDVTEGKVRFTRRDDEMAVKVGAGNYAVAMANADLATLPFTGTIRREWWSGVSAQTVEEIRDNPRYPNQPDGSELVPALELKPVSTNHLGVRFCGYLHPPLTGDYEFWLVGGPSAALFMSPDENPGEQVRVANKADSNTNLEQPRFRGASSWAPPVSLMAGRRYYVEALLFVKSGEGQLSVAWKIPARPREPLTGEYLSPFEPK